MSKKVSIDQAANEILKIMKEYADTVSEDTKPVYKQIAKEATQEVRRGSPELTGDYKKGWGNSKIKETSTEIELIIHNKTDYQLTHLLENGHPSRNGGRVPPIKHIEPVEQQMQEKLLKKVKAVIKR